MKSSALVTRSWNGHAIQRRRADGYVNATAMCQVVAKRWRDYAITLRAAEYIKALEGSAGIPAHLLAQTVVTGPNAGRGTWVHPRLAVDLARWISPEFAVWMDGWILEELEAKAKPVQLDLAVTPDDAAAVIGLACSQIGDNLNRVAGLMGSPATTTREVVSLAVECMEDSKRLLAMVDRLMRTIPAVDVKRRVAA
jgi:hypothetical protein